MSPAVGDAAPEFRLHGVHGSTGEPVTLELADLRGSPVVLAFYPADDSPVCTAQLAEYTEQFASFEDLDAQVVAISPQGPGSHRAFAESQGGFAFPLLSDEDKEVAASYGNLGMLDLYRRCTYVLDAEGRVAWVHRAIGPGLHYSTVDDLVAVISRLV